MAGRSIKMFLVDGSPIFELANVGVQALAQEIDGEFVVRKGSTARVEGVPSWTSGKVARDRLLEEGVLRQSGTQVDFYEFGEDYAFTSPSLAASVVLARNTNGRSAWRVRGTGLTYAQWAGSTVGSAS